jgi:hypothetical protein
MNPITSFLALACGAVGIGLGVLVSPLLGVPFVVAAVIVVLSLKMANAWEKFVILHAGKLQSVRGPGLFLIIPVIDTVTAVIDERLQTSAATCGGCTRPPCQTPTRSSPSRCSAIQYASRSPA